MDLFPTTNPDSASLDRSERRSPSACARARSTSSSARRRCSRPGRPLREAIEHDRAALDHPLGTAGHRQDDAGAGDRERDPRALHRVQRRAVGHQGDPRGHGRGRTGAPPIGRRTILFIDEIHRFNKAQQDAFLPRVEVRRHRAHRRDDREPVVRGELGAALALEGATSSAARRRRRSSTILRARAGGRRARPRRRSRSRRPTRRSRRSRGMRTATRASR